MKKIAILCLFFLNYTTSHASSEDTSDQIGSWLKNTMQNQSLYDIQEGLNTQARKMGLGETGKWKTSSLEKAQDLLISKDLTHKTLENFIDEVICGTHKNPYITNFLEAAKDKDLSLFISQVNQNKHHIPSVIYFGFFLDNLTKAVRNDFDLLSDIYGVWEDQTSGYLNGAKIVLKKGLPFYLKFLAVKAPWKKSVLERREGKIDPQIGQFLLPLNINIVAAYEYLRGYSDNAKVGFTLGKEKPYNSTVSLDKIMHTQIRNQEAYYDAYTAWDMAFVLELGSLHCVAKLIFPTITQYHEKPDEYFNNRLFSLMATLVYYINGDNPTIFDDSTVSKLFGTENLKSIQDYAS